MERIEDIGVDYGWGCGRTVNEADTGYFSKYDSSRSCGYGWGSSSGRVVILVQILVMVKVMVLAMVTSLVKAMVMAEVIIVLVMQTPV